MIAALHGVPFFEPVMNIVEAALTEAAMLSDSVQPQMLALRQAIATLAGYSDVWGYAASSLVLATFCMKRMVPLRVIALCSNLAFLTYAGFLHLLPIFVLHTLLVPVNIWRLAQAFRRRRTILRQSRSRRTAAAAADVGQPSSSAHRRLPTPPRPGARAPVERGRDLSAAGKASLAHADDRSGDAVRDVAWMRRSAQGWAREN